VRNYNFINAPWDELHQLAEDFRATYGYEPAPTQTGDPELQRARVSERGRAVH
jgi:hypothetical protein